LILHGRAHPDVLGPCEFPRERRRTLGALGETKELPAEAAETLTSIIAEAKEGAWEPAQLRLSRFMEGQYR